MKRFIIILLIVFFANHSGARSQNIEAEIRQLEQMEVQAILKKDTAMLTKLWDKNYVVNSPDNVIVLPGKTAVDRPVLKRSRIFFSREVERIIVRGNTVFSMGNETVVPEGDQTQSGQTVKRRYTNIWMKQEGQWKLVARHANIICQ